MTKPTQCLLWTFAILVGQSNTAAWAEEPSGKTATGVIVALCSNYTGPCVDLEKQQVPAADSKPTRGPRVSGPKLKSVLIKTATGEARYSIGEGVDLDTPIHSGDKVSIVYYVIEEDADRKVFGQFGLQSLKKSH